MARQTIAIDIDDVLADSASDFVEYSNKRWGTNLTVDDYTEHWGDMWKVDMEEWERRAREYHGSGAITRLNPHLQAMPVLEKLRHKYKLVIVTSRRSQVNKETLQWIDIFYSGMFEEVHFAGMWDKVTEHSDKATKAEICKQIDADYLIDDHPKHCLAVADSGIETLLFGTYSWNDKVGKLPKGVTRVKNWEEVGDYFDDRG